MQTTSDSDNLKKLIELESEIKHLKNKIDILNQKVEIFSSKNTVTEYIVSEIQKGQYWRADLEVLKQRVEFIDTKLEGFSQSIKKMEEIIDELKEFKQVVHNIKENNIKIITIGISLGGLIFGIVSKFL